MRILCVGANHKTAPVSLRERLAFDAGSARSALEALRDRYDQAEFVILSTCNRSEVYTARPVHGRPREAELRGLFGKFHGLGPEKYEPALYFHADADAVRHLFAVAAGLDSLVPGEDQILAQLKQAYRLAGEVSAVRGRLDELFQLAFNVGKQVRAATGIASGKVSVASVAVDFVRERFPDFAGKRILSIGAGKMNELMLRGLSEAGAGYIFVANRSPARAAELAGHCNGQVVGFDELDAALGRADVVVCSTGSSDPVLTRAKLESAMAGRAERPMLIIDIAVPRDVEPAAGEVEGVRLYNIDDLTAVVEKTLRLRTAEMDAGRRIIDEHVAAYFHRLHVRQVVPTVEALYRRMRAIAGEELAAMRSKLTGVPATDEKLAQRAFHRALRRILHTPIANLRSAAGSEAARQHAAALRKLFDLPEHEPRPPGREPPGTAD